ncbi:MAG: hypothetical protein R3C11_05220 [Planctomycetaceae bacterium]
MKTDDRPGHFQGPFHVKVTSVLPLLSFVFVQEIAHCPNDTDKADDMTQSQ